MRVAYPMGLAFASVACPTPPADTPPPTPTADTAPIAEVTCAVDPANALRGRCTTTLDAPEQMTLTAGPADSMRPFVWSATGQAVLTLLPEDTEITWRATQGEERWSGTFRTGRLSEREGIVTTITGTAPFPTVGFVSPCLTGATAMVADATTGTVLWSQSFVDEGQGGALDSVSFTDRQTVVAIINGGLREVDVTGHVLLDRPANTLPYALHHDAIRHGDHVYALYHRTITDPKGRVYLLDGFQVFDDDATIVADWFLGDHHTPTVHEPELGPTDDYSHANSIWVDVDGHVVLSFRHVSTVLKVRGVHDPAFGEILWRWAGGADGLLGSDIVTNNETGGPEGFARQHHALRGSDGRWSMFDNRAVGLERSRVLVADLDESTGTARLLDAYDLGTTCAFQGAAFPLASGGFVATCAPTRTALAFAPKAPGRDDAPEPVDWSFQTSCQGVSTPFVPRFTPLDW